MNRECRRRLRTCVPIGKMVSYNIRWIKFTPQNAPAVRRGRKGERHRVNWDLLATYVARAVALLTRSPCMNPPMRGRRTSWETLQPSAMAVCR